jgi:hypothetical protein
MNRSTSSAIPIATISSYRGQGQRGAGDDRGDANGHNERGGEMSREQAGDRREHASMPQARGDRVGPVGAGRDHEEDRDDPEGGDEAE